LAFHQVKQDAENIFVGDDFKSIERKENVFCERIQSTMENDN
jgi:hypothetical protein